MSRPEVKLAWVIVGDQLQHVAQFQGQQPLPPATCPHCGQALILKVNGQRRTPHAAHRSDSLCPASQPESALHQNVKFYLAAQLQTAHTLIIKEACATDRHIATACQASHLRTLVDQWDSVQLERTLDPLRPDLVLLRAGQPVAAIEVLVTHAVDDHKAAVYEQLGIPWIEVRATQALYEESTAWTPDQPLSATRTDQAWHCARCAPAWQRAREQLQQARQQAEFWLCFKPDLFRVLDVYSLYGDHVRVVCHVGNLLTADGQAESRCLVANTDIVARVAATDPAGLQQLNAAHRAYRQRLNRAGFVDSAMTSWAACESFKAISRGDPLWPPRYFWDSADRQWVRRADADSIQWCPDGHNAEANQLPLSMPALEQEWGARARRRIARCLYLALPQIAERNWPAVWEHFSEAQVLLEAVAIKGGLGGLDQDTLDLQHQYCAALVAIGTLGGR